MVKNLRNLLTRHPQHFRPNSLVPAVDQCQAHATHQLGELGQVVPFLILSTQNRNHNNNKTNAGKLINSPPSPSQISCTKLCITNLHHMKQCADKYPLSTEQLYLVKFNSHKTSNFQMHTFVSRQTHIIS